MSIDWSANRTRRSHYELTCENARTATMAPVVVQRWIDPVSDPVAGGTPQAKGLVKRLGAAEGEKVAIMEGHCFLSSTSSLKGPGVTRWMVGKILDGYKE